MRSREGRRQPKTLNRDYPREEVVKPRGIVGEPSPSPAQSGTSPRGDQGDSLMEKVVARDNMLAALKRVEQNKGAPGVDGIPTENLREQIRAEWPRIREELLTGTYRPQPVRRVEIPKPGGGKRMLGIPTVMDRLIQQALLQVLTPIFDPQFSEASYGFRPGRRAHEAVKKARQYVEEGYEWGVDMDLEKFFDPGES
ncbi:Group II intron reverse transcriptase/maturase (fragment) [Kyrpidia spormannii]|uniref:Group II intron reverse transcriptase/maturase n=1 Tax=Kyrpidia spormannii TaxID=2055160 RepID=A0A6F9EDP4_9BACL